MTSRGLAGSERKDLCALLDELGPDAPTLCEGWKTVDLAAHLFVRERRPHATPGILLEPLSGITTRAMRKAIAKLGYTGLVAKVRSGPPLLWWPIDGAVNTIEYFVHTEDVRRAQPEWEPRESAELDAAAWKSLKMAARLYGHKIKDAGMVLVRTDGERIVASKATPAVTISGGAQELLLFLYGRGKATRTTIEGDDAARAALDRANFSI
jgi:uncharacterized protein (TIGR03085 family)